ncbi:MAG: hypothetical protein FJY54_01995 [Betaproteobacteria bacterium]|nr:hypothetical protein [Betaproteobacteria bacterium]
MIFMSQSGLADPARAPEWDAWYVEHLRIMLTVAGIHSAQRFKTEDPGHPPSLAMYTLDGAGVFDDPYYRSVRGLGEWQPLIDRHYYRRNLFSGLDRAPEVGPGACLVVADREREDASLSGLTLTWLVCVGIDRSTRVRGIAVLGEAAAARVERHAVAVYRPATRYMTPRVAG